MAAFSTKYNIRSISLPARSHPCMIKIAEHLNKLKLCETYSPSNSKQICNGLFSLGEIYKCVDDILNLPMIQQAISRYQTEKWVSELIDGSIKYLDICSKTSEAVVLMIEHVRELQSALRRSNGANLSTIVQQNHKTFSCHRKQMKKELSKSIDILKHMGKNKFVTTTDIDTDHFLSAVTKVVTEANTMAVSIFESIAMFLFVPLMKLKANRWSLVSKLTHKGNVVLEQEENTHELERVDIALTDLLVHGLTAETEKIQCAHKKLENLELCMEGIANGLDGLFKNLIHTRVTLLNILSQ